MAKPLLSDQLFMSIGLSPPVDGQPELMCNDERISVEIELISHSSHQGEGSLI